MNLVSTQTLTGPVSRARAIAAHLSARPRPRHQQGTSGSNLTAAEVDVGDVCYLAHRSQISHGSVVEHYASEDGNPFGHPVLVVAKHQGTCEFHTITSFEGQAVGVKYPNLKWRQHERYVPIATVNDHPAQGYENPSYPFEWLRMGCNSTSLDKPSYVIADRRLEVEYRYLRPYKTGQDTYVSFNDVKEMETWDITKSFPQGHPHFQEPVPPRHPGHRNKKGSRSTSHQRPVEMRKWRSAESVIHGGYDHHHHRQQEDDLDHRRSWPKSDRWHLPQTDRYIPPHRR